MACSLGLGLVELEWVMKNVCSGDLGIYVDTYVLQTRTTLKPSMEEPPKKFLTVLADFSMNFSPFPASSAASAASLKWMMMKNKNIC